MPSDQEHMQSIRAKLAGAASDTTDATQAVLSGIEAFIVQHALKQRDYLRDQMTGAGVAFARRDHDLDVMRAELKRLQEKIEQAREAVASMKCPRCDNKGYGEHIQFATDTSPTFRHRFPCPVCGAIRAVLAAVDTETNE